MDFTELRLGSARLLGAEATSLSPRQRRQALGVLSADDRKRLAHLNDARADAFLTGRLLVSVALDDPAPLLEASCGHCGSAEHGKPRLREQPMLVSISYAGSAVFVALADSDHVSALGLDVEEAGLEAGAGAAAELERWTATEAVLKADGRGLRVDPSEVQLDADGLARIRGEGALYRLRQTLVDGRFVVAVATASASGD
ncbi:hypothetical protein [Pseudoclavibacter sp. VKM Ac-2867]|uniref:hypothetical protein n=1 Tax=Pseudoclavibacter sp. VKM Ac-2867 TaxID=2783829 RepID=UPI00188B87DE|nr:hypothetical protein [Pseudoclavibacter sp. VKM Ac-2867]MBF4459561.1 hypothetical protein [Pseudoclavibacter sp. VKM Ac-2867]